MNSKKSLAVSIVLVLGIAVATAKAAVVENDVTDIDLSVFVPCAAGGVGELVDLSGPLHTLVSFTENDKNVSGYFHSQPQGISGTGESTGDKYQGTGVTQESFETSFQNGQANLTFVNNFRIIGQGPKNNFLVHETLHLTFNANGTLTVSHDNFSGACR
jgi:hypothetical protein